jgi:hypothetical protein
MGVLTTFKDQSTMADRRPVVEGHLNTATSALERHVKALPKEKADKKSLNRNPKYRQLAAKVTKYKTQLAAIDKAVKVFADMEQRTAERRAQPKVKKPKKKPVAAAPKAKKEPKKAKAE